MLWVSGGEAHPQKQLDGDLHRPAGASQAQRTCHRGKGGAQTGFLPLLEYQALLHQVRCLYLLILLLASCSSLLPLWMLLLLLLLSTVKSEACHQCSLNVNCQKSDMRDPVTIEECKVWCRNHIVMEDLEAFLTPEQAREAFDILDNNGDGKLVLADIRDAVIKIYKERRNLALSLKVPFLLYAACRPHSLLQTQSWRQCAAVLEQCTGAC